MAASDRSRWRRPMLAVCLLAALTGCSGYPEVSPKTYEFAKALYSICNRERTEKLAPVSAQIEEAAAAGDITDREKGWLLEIVITAEAGKWDEAEAEARRLMEDQVGR